MAELIEDKVGSCFLSSHGQGRSADLVGGFEGSFARGFFYTVIGIGGDMFADFEDGLEVVMSADAARNLGRIKSVAALFGEITQDALLKINDAGCGFLAGLDTRLIVSV